MPMKSQCSRHVDGTNRSKSEDFPWDTPVSASLFEAK